MVWVRVRIWVRVILIVTLKVSVTGMVRVSKVLGLGYNADCDGWVMSVVWRMVAFQKTSSTGSWLWGGEPPATLTCDIKMSA